MNNQTKKIKHKIRELTECRHVECGWGFGYVGVPEGHPWFEVGYWDIDGVPIHGDMTYSRLENDGLWWVGFDTAHYGDNKGNWSEENVLAETLKLKRMARRAYNE